MKHRTLTVFLLLAALLPIAAFAQTITGPDGNEYNANDWNKVEAAKEANGLKDEHVTWTEINGEMRLTRVDAPAAGLSGVLDLSDCTELTRLYCPWNPLTSINLSGCMKLDSIDSGACGSMTSLDVSGCMALRDLWSPRCALESLNLTGYTGLVYLSVQENQLTSLDVSGCTALEWLSCDNNQLMSLNASGCTALRELYCGYNQLMSLNVSGCTAMESLHCGDNQLTTLDVSGCTALEALWCWNNYLTALDFTGCTALEVLSCFHNHLTSLDFSDHSNLCELNFWGNRLTSFDVSCNTALTFLNCGHNDLTSLDISNNTELREFHCQYNQLTSLNVSNNKALQYLHCNENQLKSMDVSTLTLLTRFHCWNNELTSLRVSLVQSFDDFDYFGNPELPFVEVVIADTLSNLDTLNLLKASLFQKTQTEYAWYYADGTDVSANAYTETNGGFVFHGLGNGDVIYCEMTCDAFPGLTLRTTPIAITGAVTLPPTLPPGADIDITLPTLPGGTGGASSVADNIVETSNGIWEFTFNVTVKYDDGTTVDVPQKVEIPKNGSGEEDLGNGYYLVYDIKGNGKNVKELKIVKKEN